MSDPDFESLVERFYESLYRFALSLARNEHEACDLTQQTFTIWANKGHQLREPSKVKSWLFSTLHREFLGGRRHAARFPQQELEASDHELPAIEPNLVSGLDGQAVLAALREIEEPYRAPLTLFYLRDHSYQEIAEILEIPIGTVMSRISRGKQALRARFLDRKGALRS